MGKHYIDVQREELIFLVDIQKQLTRLSEGKELRDVVNEEACHQDDATSRNRGADQRGLSQVTRQVLVEVEFLQEVAPFSLSFHLVFIN